MGANSALSQPQQALTFDRSNPITRGLTVAILPIGAGPRDVVVNAAPTLTGPLVLATYPAGRAWIHGSGSYSLFDSPVYGAVGADGGITEFCLLSVSSTDDWGCFWTSGDGVAQTTTTVVNRISNGTNFTYAVDNGAAGVDTAGGEMTTLLDGAMHALLCTAGPAGLRIDLDGKTVASTTGISASRSNGRLIFARDISTNGSQATANYALYLRWNRSLTLGESISLKRNPWQIFYESAAAFSAFSAASGVSAALTGVAGTGSVGTTNVAADNALTGNSGTCAAGTVVPAVSKALTGNQATGSVGTVGVAVTIALTGVQGTGQVGNVAAIAGYGAALSGVSGTGSAGSVSPSTARALTGNAATGAVGSIAPATAKALTGNAATGAVGSVSAASSKQLTGSAATGSAGTLSPGVTIALTGASATGVVGSVSAGADANQALTGVSGTGAAGTVSPSVTVAMAGVSGTGSVGTVSPSSSKALTGIEATGALGSVSQNVTVALSGVEASGEVGTISFVAGDITIALTGVQATGAAGVLAVAGEFSAIAAAVWSYVLSNGKTAGQNVVEIRAMLDLLTPGFWNFAIEGPYTAADLLRVIAAVQAGKSTITALGAGAATVEFRAVDDSEVRVTADMQGSERTEVTLNAN